MISRLILILALPVVAWLFLPSSDAFQFRLSLQIFPLVDRLGERPLKPALLIKFPIYVRGKLYRNFTTPRQRRHDTACVFQLPVARMHHPCTNCMDRGSNPYGQFLITPTDMVAMSYLLPASGTLQRGTLAQGWETMYAVRRHRRQPSGGWFSEWLSGPSLWTMG